MPQKPDPPPEPPPSSAPHAHAIAIRLANQDEPSDHGVVVALLGELVAELGSDVGAEEVLVRLDADIAQALASDDVCIFLAESDGTAVGLARGDILHDDPVFRLRAENRCGYVDQMFVRVGHRSRGLGKRLLKQCEAWFRERGIGHCLLHAAPKAAQFYARLGYQTNREMFRKL